MSIKITTESLPDSEVGWFYWTILKAATVPESPIIWRLVGHLPDTLEFDPQNGILSGMCKTKWHRGLGVIAKSENTGEEVFKAFVLSVKPAEPVVLLLHVTSEPFPSGKVGVAYASPIGLSGGTPPYRYWVSPIPKGLHLNGLALEGVPEEAGKWVIKIGVEDSSEPTMTASNQREFEIDIK